MGRPLKTIDKCAADWCRQKAEIDAFCKEHSREWDEEHRVGPKPDPILAWVQVCFVCSHESYHEMTAKQRDKVMAQYRLICPSCRKASVTLERVDHLVQRAA